MVFCTKCGQQNNGGKFCSGCGEPMKLEGGSDGFLPGNVGVVSSAEERDQHLSVAMGGADVHMIKRDDQSATTKDRRLGSCRACARPVKGQGVQANGGVYHQDCFQCCGQGCTVNFFRTNRQFLEKDGNIYCDACHVKVEGHDVCGGCRQALTGTKMKALGKLWHPHCFQCKGCGQGFPDKKFVNRDGFPFHSGCK